MLLESTVLPLNYACKFLSLSNLTVLVYPIFSYPNQYDIVEVCHNRISTKWHPRFTHPISNFLSHKIPNFDTRRNRQRRNVISATGDSRRLMALWENRTPVKPGSGLAFHHMLTVPTNTHICIFRGATPNVLSPNYHVRNQVAVQHLSSGRIGYNLRRWYRTNTDRPHLITL